MGRYELEYPKDAINSIKRHDERGVYALQKIHELVNSTKMINISFNPPGSPFPIVMPMVGQMGSFERPSSGLGDPLDLYLHGYVSSRLMNLGRDSEGNGMPVCVAAQQVDGLILAISAFNHDINYRSVMLFGHATLVTDAEEKLYALELITNGVVPDRWRNSRLPPTGAELQSTSVLKVKIVSGSGKFRDGGVVDSKDDMNNEDVLNGVWTGILPIYSVMGEPVAGSYNRLDLPTHVSEYVADYNKENMEYSLAAAKK